MKKGVCIKCGQKTVYKSTEGIKFSIGGGLYIENLKNTFNTPVQDYDIYICTTCGYYETYIFETDKLKKIESHWEKI
jgi:hypothetical protein